MEYSVVNLIFEE